MFPFQKIFTLLIRTFSRPMLGYLKNKQKLKENSIFGRIFIGLGRRTFALEHWINYRMLKTLTPKKHTLYKQQVLLEKGVQTFYEILFYMIVMGLPFWQLYKGSIASLEKEKTLQKRIIGLDHKLEHINKRIDKLQQVIVKRSKAKALKAKQVEKPSNISQAEKLSSLSQQIGIQLQEPTEQIDLQEIIQHAVQVVADEFQDSLDELELSFTQDSQSAMASGTSQPQLYEQMAANLESDQIGVGDGEPVDELQLDSIPLQNASISLQEVDVQIGQSLGEVAGQVSE